MRAKTPRWVGRRDNTGYQCIRGGLQSMTGLEDFKRLLREFRTLSLSIAGGSAVLPFIAWFASVIPPFPPGLNIMTAVFQLVSLAFVYQKYLGSSRSRITRNMEILFVLLGLIIIVYMVTFSLLTIYIPDGKRSIVVGFQCTPDALTIKEYRDKCPSLGLEELAGVAYDEFVLWTRSSIAINRAILIALWLSFFVCLSMLLGQFLVFQMKRKVSPA